MYCWSYAYSAPAPTIGREQQADEERDAKRSAARWAARLRNGDPDGIGGRRGHGSDILAVGRTGVPSMNGAR